MRKATTTLATAIAIGLLAGSTVGVAAQDAGADPMAAAWVTGSVTLASDCARPQIENDGSGGLLRRERGARCQGQTWDTDDERLAGEAVSTSEVDVYAVEGGSVSVRAGGYDIRTEAGGWSCRHTGVAQGAHFTLKPASGETLV